MLKNKNTLLYLLSIGGGIFLFSLLYVSKFSIGITPDSIGYLSVADNLKISGKAILYSHEYLTAQPLLYPFLIAIISKALAISSLFSSVLLNSFVYAGFILLSYTLLKPLTKHCAITCIIISCANPAALYIALHGWSDLLFCCLSLGAIVSAHQYQKDLQLKWLLLGALAIALATLSRYIGVSLLLWFNCVLLLAHSQKNTPWFIRSAIFNIGAAAPLALQLIFNYSVSGHILVERGSPANAFYEPFILSLLTIGFWFLPLWPILLHSLFKKKSLALSHNYLLSTFIGCYLFVLLTMASISAFDPIDSRLLAPLFIPLAVLLLNRLSSPKSRWQRYSLNAWLGLLIIVSSALAYIQLTQGFAYQQNHWRYSETLTAFQQYKAQTDCQWLSNADDFIYFKTGQSISRLPQTHYYRSTTKMHSMAGIKQQFNTGNYCIAWFDHGFHNYLITPKQLSTMFTLATVIKLNDGTIYTFSVAP